MESIKDQIKALDLLDDGLLDYEEAMETSEAKAPPSNILPDVTTMADASSSVVFSTQECPVAPPQPTTLAEALALNNPPREQVEASAFNPSTGLKVKRPSCPMCSKNHPIRFCFKFRDMSLERRLRMVAVHRVCFRCLAQTHVGKDCRSASTCKHCNQAHHSLLHEHKRRKAHQARPISQPQLVVPIRQAVAFSPTLRIKLSHTRNKVPVRAVLDSCCQSSYICRELVNKLRLPKFVVNGEDYCQVEIESIHDASQRLSVTAKVRKMNGIKTPLVSVPDTILEPFQGLQLADPTFHHSGTVAFVLGPELIPLLMKARIQASPGLPLAQYTTFGWVISGLSPY